MTLKGCIYLFMEVATTHVGNTLKSPHSLALFLQAWCRLTARGYLFPPRLSPTWFRTALNITNPHCRCANGGRVNKVSV